MRPEGHTETPGTHISNGYSGRGGGEGRGGEAASLGRGAYVFTAARPWLGGGMSSRQLETGSLFVDIHTVCTCYGI